MKVTDIIGLLTMLIVAFLSFSVSATIAVNTFTHETGIAAITGLFVAFVFYIISLLCLLSLYKLIVKK